MSQEILIEREADEESSANTYAALFLVILICHVAVDALAALLPSTLGLIEVRLSLTPKQSAWLMGIGSLCSGLAQPICAYISDRLSSRLLGVAGIVLCAVGIGSLGMPATLPAMVLVYVVGMLGVGMFHPFGAATVGELRKHARTSAVSIFFVAGMVGGVAGAFFWPRFLSTSVGFRWLPLTVLPVLLMVVYLLRHLRDLGPMQVAHHKVENEAAPAVAWGMVAILYIAAATRFCVNTALLYLYVRWAEVFVLAESPGLGSQEVATVAAPMVGNFNAATLLGMAVGGLLAGAWVVPGKEKWPMVLVPLGFAPIIAVLPYSSLYMGYVLAVLAGVGFAAMIPVTIALAQHLMPRHTNLASGLMMGGAWSVAMIGPRCAEFGVSKFGITTTFALTAGVLAVSGLLCLPLRED